ncbi:MAG: hypothetical protein WCX22_13135 [Methanoregula sp.]
MINAMMPAWRQDLQALVLTGHGPVPTAGYCRRPVLEERLAYGMSAGSRGRHSPLCIRVCR